MPAYCSAYSRQETVLAWGDAHAALNGGKPRTPADATPEAFPPAKAFPKTKPKR